jgi:cell wall-associated NlpC family hydrolase
MSQARGAVIVASTAFPRLRSRPIYSKPTQRRLLSYGDIIFYTYPGETVPHHVVIYLGGDKILQAPETGQNVGYGTLSEFSGQTATVRRVTEP